MGFAICDHKANYGLARCSTATDITTPYDLHSCKKCHTVYIYTYVYIYIHTVLYYTILYYTIPLYCCFLDNREVVVVVVPVVSDCPKSSSPALCTYGDKRYKVFINHCMSILTVA